MKKVGILTFHNSYNCGSMLETYALHKYLSNQHIDNEIIDFSTVGQRKLYAVYYKADGIKNIVKNLIILFHYQNVKKNNEMYQKFQRDYFKLSEKNYINAANLDDEAYSIVVSGSDQVWNITIEDSDDAYFLPWVKRARKVAYAPSFGAKKLSKYAECPEKYKEYLNDFNALSIREKNGQKWLKEFIQKDVPVLIDPTLLLNQSDYEEILYNDIRLPEKYIFFYCPIFDKKICKFVKKISKKYNLPVITWNSKKYYIHGIKRFGFHLPDLENPSIYLKLIKDATLVITTSFHGTIFSTIFRKNFYTVKNGEMYGDDDRVKTLMESLKIESRLIPCDFDVNKDYLESVDYRYYDKELIMLQKKAKKYIKDNIGDYYGTN